MFQELFRIPIIDHPIYGYGVMLVIGLLCAAQLGKYLARRFGYNGEHFFNAAILALVTGVIGARLSHVLESIFTGKREFINNGRSFGENFLEMLNVSSGGLTFYGGFIVATPILIWYAIKKRVPVLRGMDIVAPCVMMGLAFGRIGCFANGCCYGDLCELPWGVRFPYGSNAYVEQFEKGQIVPHPDLMERGRDDRLRLRPAPKVRESRQLGDLAKTERALPVHPTQIYSAFNAGLICIALIAFLSLAPAPGRVFALMLILKGLSRYTLEMIRVEPRVYFGVFSHSMMLSIVLFVIGVIMWVVCGKIATARRNAGLALASGTSAC